MPGGKGQGVAIWHNCSQQNNSPGTARLPPPGLATQCPRHRPRHCPHSGSMAPASPPGARTCRHETSGTLRRSMTQPQPAEAGDTPEKALVQGGGGSGGRGSGRRVRGRGQEKETKAPVRSRCVQTFVSEMTRHPDEGLQRRERRADARGPGVPVGGLRRLRPRAVFPRSGAMGPGPSGRGLGLG